jgi:pimeloyl-ACP methyl ester carboxylesterase
LGTFLAVLPLLAAEPVADIRSYPPPGRLVDAGGHRLHLNLMGKGKPAVVLEAGAGSFSFEWSLVQPEVAKFTQIVAYDRAGYSWSDPGPKPRTMRQIAYELHTSLKHAGVEPPYVLVGASLGGLMARVYADQYPTEVAGMVFDDSTHEDTVLFLNGKPTRMRELARGRPIPPVQTHWEKPPPSQPPKESPTPPAPAGKPEEPFDRLPATLQQLRLSARSEPSFQEANAGEFELLAEELAFMHADRLKRPQPLGHLPLISLAPVGVGGDETPPPGVSAEEWKKLREEKAEQKRDLATLSSKGQCRLIERSGHEIHLYRPDAVIQAIRDVVEAARRQRRSA